MQDPEEQKMDANDMAAEQNYFTLEEGAAMFAQPEDSLEVTELDILKAYAQVKIDIKAMKTKLSTLETQRDELKIEALAIMDAGGIGKINVLNRTLSPSSRTWFYVRADQKDAAHLWLKANGFEAIVKESANVVSMSSQLKEFEDQGHTIPTEFFEKSIKRDLKATK